MQHPPVDCQYFFFGSKKSVFVTRTAEKLTASGTPIGICDFQQSIHFSKPFRVFSKVVEILLGAKNTLIYISKIKKAETAVIHSLSPHLFWLAPILKIRFRKVVAIAYGSDILRRKKAFDPLLYFGAFFVDVFRATNTNVHDVAITNFPRLNKNSGIIRFGLSIFDEIDRAKIKGISEKEARLRLGLDPEKEIISLGYSATPGQRQIELINLFSNIKNSNLSFIIPVQYGDEEVKKAIVSLSKKASGALLFTPITDFYNEEKMALLRLATSVLINHSISDAFSGSVQETIYAGGGAIAGAWLPYKNMPGYGSAILTYENLNEIPALLSSQEYANWKVRIKNTAQANQAALHQASSWDAVLQDWQQLITS